MIPDRGSLQGKEFTEPIVEGPILHLKAMTADFRPAHSMAVATITEPQSQWPHKTTQVVCHEPPTSGGSQETREEATLCPTPNNPT